MLETYRLDSKVMEAATATGGLALMAMDLAKGRPDPRITGVPPYAITRDGRLEALARDQVAATLAAGMIAASGTAGTAEEAAALFREVRAALYPEAPSGD